MWLLGLSVFFSVKGNYDLFLKIGETEWVCEYKTAQGTLRIDIYTYVMGISEITITYSEII